MGDPPRGLEQFMDGWSETGKKDKFMKKCWKSIKRSLFSLGSFYLTHETDNTTSVK